MWRWMLLLLFYNLTLLHESYVFEVYRSADHISLKKRIIYLSKSKPAFDFDQWALKDKMRHGATSWKLYLQKLFVSRNSIQDTISSPSTAIGLSCQIWITSLSSTHTQYMVIYNTFPSLTELIFIYDASQLSFDATFPTQRSISAPLRLTNYHSQ